MEVTELFSFIKDFGFPVVLSWFLLVRMENKLAGLTDVISELSCNIIATIMALDRAIRCGNESGESVYDGRGILQI